MYEPSKGAQSLDYYRQRQFKPGWQDLIQVMFSGILSSADDEDGRAFLQLMGRQLAQKHPLPPAHTVGELEDHLNALLARFDWGVIHIDISEQGLTLTHSAYPPASEEDEQARWTVAFAAVLSGAYSEWLKEQGGASHVPLRWQQQTAGAVLVFLYGNAQ